MAFLLMAYIKKGTHKFYFRSLMPVAAKAAQTCFFLFAAADNLCVYCFFKGYQQILFVYWRNGSKYEVAQLNDRLGITGAQR